MSTSIRSRSLLGPTGSSVGNVGGLGGKLPGPKQPPLEVRLLQGRRQQTQGLGQQSAEAPDGVSMFRRVVHAPGPADVTVLAIGPAPVEQRPVVPIAVEPQSATDAAKDIPGRDKASWAAVRFMPARPSGPDRFNRAAQERHRCFAGDFTSHARRHHLVWCILLAGDVASNPGPRHSVCPCCTKRVRDNQAALCCHSCTGWFHRGCIHLSLAHYRQLGSLSDPWFCLVCSLPQFSDDFFEVPLPPPATLPKVAGPPVTRGDGGVCRPPRKDSGRAPRAKGVNKALTLWYTNCRSLKNKMQDFHATASSLPDNAILLLTETWLDSSVHDVDRRYDLEHPDLEAIFLELHLPHGTVLLGCVYCPPSTRNSAYQLLDASVTRALLKPYRDILLIGDFNSHIDWWNSDEPVPGDAFDDLLLDATSSAGLFQVCRSPTYLPRNSFLDLVFTTDLTKILSCDVYPGLSGSDHMAVEVSFATSLPRKGHFACTIWRFLETDHAHLASLAHFAPWGVPGNLSS
ncbi:hypothetical protein ISCGN_019667 [Ixodes scapularis]